MYLHTGAETARRFVLGVDLGRDDQGVVLR